MSDLREHGIVAAILFDGQGGGTHLTWDQMNQWSPTKGRLWVHLDYTHEGAQTWVKQHKDLNPLVKAALLAGENRPRVTRMREGLLIALRGVNLNPGKNPEDMVSIRIWATDNLVVSSRRRHLLSVQDLITRLENGNGPVDVGDFLVELSDQLVMRMSDTVDQFEHTMASLEAQLIENGDPLKLRLELAKLRRQTIALKRYLSPEREALEHLLREDVDWINDQNRDELREVNDRITRHLEDIEAVRERAAVSQEELSTRVNQQLNKRMYILSIVSVIFLPLGFLTGLMSVSLDGLPWQDETDGFWGFTTFLGIIFILQVIFYRMKKWL